MSTDTIAVTDTATLAPPKVSEIIAKYIALRDKRDERVREHKKEIAALNAALASVEAYLKRQLTDIGVESLSTEAGTAFKVRRTSAGVGDWDQFLAFVQENDAWGMLERRVSKTAVAEYRDEHDDLPPGVNWTEDEVVQIRRP